MGRNGRVRWLPAWVGALALVTSGAVVPAPSAGASSVPQLGFNSYVQELCQSPAVWRGDAVGQFGALKSLGANSVALAFPLYTPGLRSDEVVAKQKCGTSYETPSPARLAVAIEAARGLHLRVFLRPLIDETDLRTAGGWRGALKPRSVEAWFKSYLTTLTPYLRLAQQQHVQYFAISTELMSLDTSTRWASLLASAKRIYKGTLVFTGIWKPGGMVRHAGTATGLDTYQGLLDPTTTSVSKLLQGWNAAATTSNRIPYPLSTASIDEVAILAQDGAYAAPWSWSLPESTYPFDQSIQANWYQMVCQFFWSHHMQGLYFWGVWYATGAQAVLQVPTASQPQRVQPASAQAIKECYAR